MKFRRNKTTTTTYTTTNTAHDHTTHSYTQGRYGVGTVTREGYLPDFYKRFPDPYVTLTLGGQGARDSGVELG